MIELGLLMVRPKTPNCHPDGLLCLLYLIQISGMCNLNLQRLWHQLNPFSKVWTANVEACSYEGQRATETHTPTKNLHI